MYKLDNKGYQPYTPQELREELIKRNKKDNLEFEDRPASLQNNLIDTGVVFATYFEQLISDLFNGYAIGHAPELLFESAGADFGLRRKGSYKSQVDIKFEGTQGTLIPRGTTIQDTNKSVTFKVEEDVVIGSTGETIVTCYSDDELIPPLAVGALTELPNIKGLTASNINTPTEPQKEESFEDFRKRVQQIMRNPRGGSFEYLEAKIKGIEGVESRSVSINVGEQQSQGKTYKGYEVIVAGGKPSDIAYELMRSGGINPLSFISTPSNNESTRTVTQNLILNSQSIPYKFTRPKLIKLRLKINISVIGITTTNTSLNALTKPAMEEYINSSCVGQKINYASLTTHFMKGFALAGGTDENINAKSFTFECKDLTAGVGGTLINFTTQGFLDLKHDQYCTLAEYVVEINR